MKLLIGKFIFVMIILLISPGCIHQNKSRTVIKAERKAGRMDKKREGTYEKDRKKELKHRYEIQTKEVQQRMKQSRKEAEKFNREMRKHDPFIKRLIRKIFKK